MSSLRIGTMRAPDLDRVIDWAADEGWNPGLSDAGAFLAADPGGFLMGWLDDEPVGAISCVRYGSGFAFVGLFIVHPVHRGRGIGARLWAAAMERAGSRVTGLDGVVAMQDSYARSGFSLAHRNIRFGGSLAGAAAVDAAVVPLRAADVDELSGYDASCFGAPRPAFLARWLSDDAASTIGVRRAGVLRGYGVVRPARVGYRVGPLFADDDATARQLLAGLAIRTGTSAEVYWDVPETNGPAVAMARGLGMSPAFETARMYRGGDPQLPLDRVFGITSFELG